MRRYVAFKNTRQGLVAIYDALLFLMVIILISEGMFLYTATSADRNGEFSDDHYQHLADTGRIMVEALSLNQSHPMPIVEWSNGTGSETKPLNEWIEDWLIPPEAYTVQWLLDSYAVLTTLNEDDSGNWDGTFDTDPIAETVDAIFAENRLGGTDHAWLYLYEGEVELFGSNTVDAVEDLPENRWASSSDYSSEFEIDLISYSYEAELRYFIWLQ